MMPHEEERIDGDSVSDIARILSRIDENLDDMDRAIRMSGLRRMLEPKQERIKSLVHILRLYLGL